ncbi:CHAT domain-containing protein [Streptomyces mirabilis]|uniref:CHAT domain-containing protein n=1 Tax=Streptomyces mirabilis TaxID=68239 RepID=UPI0033DAED1A
MSVDETFALGLVQQWMDTGDPALLSPAIDAMSGVVAEARSRRSPDLESEYIVTGLLMSRAEQRGAVADLDAVILLMRRAARETGERAALSWLGRALVARFQRTEEQPDLDEALDVLGGAVAAAPADSPQYPAMVTDLLKTSWLPLSRSGDATALTAAITVARRALRLVSDRNPGKAALALETATALRHRSIRTRNADDELIIDVCREALRLRPADPVERTRVLSLLRDAHQSRYDRHGDSADLDDAIKLGRRLVDALRAVDPRPARSLFDLGRALRSRFARDGRPDDLREAVELMQRAVDEAEPHDDDRYIYRAALLQYLDDRSKHTGDTVDRDQEIAVNRRTAQSLPADDPQRELFLTNLGRLLFARYQDSGDAANLSESVDALRQAADLAARTGDVYLGDSTRVHLGFALVAVFYRTGDLAALDEALEIGRTDGLHAVRRSDDGRARLTPVLPADDWRQARMEPHDDRQTRASLTIVLADALSTRYEQTGDLADLDDAITLATTALDLSSAADLKRRVEATNQLARIHALRHLRTRDRADLDRAVETADTLLAMLPQGHHYRPVALSNLTVLLTRRFHESRNTADLDRAIQDAEEALASAPGEKPGARARAQNALAHALLQRHGLRRGADDLARAVDLARSAARGTPDDAPATTEGLGVLMAALRARYDYAQNATDLAEAIDLAKQVLRTELSPPSNRLEIVEECASWAARHGAWEPAAELYAACVDLMARLASPDRHSDTRRYWLSRWALLTQRASASALNAGDPQAATVLLERGRGVLLSQTFDLREDLADLRTHDRDLADRVERLRRQLDDAPLLGTGPAPRLYTLDPEAAAAQDIGLQRRRLLNQFDELLAEIRSRPGFEQYLRPAQWADLIAQDGHGPLAIPNISEHRSDALIVSDGNLRTVQLPHATPNALRHAVGSMLTALDRSNTAWRRRDRDAQLRAQSEIEAVLAWLWDAITEPVLRELDITGPPAPGRPWPRMWWVPTGLLSLLPLHAAQRGDHCALDRVISSYTPTIRALRVARGQVPARERRILAVAMPATPGAPPLPFADREAVALASRFGEIVTLSGLQATRERVRAEIPEHTWAHFACHGLSDPADPGANRLLLHDHRDRPFTIGEIAGLRLDNAELAYLSACETARAADGLADEAVHLGSAFQLAGYQHVVATLWAIRDDIGAELADNFYAHLLDEQSGPAAALHHACRNVRQKFGNFPALWASHLHIGP